MKAWVLVLILGTPGTPYTEHYVSIVTPSEQTCIAMRDDYFTVGHTYTDLGIESQKVTPMVVIDRQCTLGDASRAASYPED